MFKAFSFISATTHIPPPILVALGYAPDIPPKPEVTNTFPSKDGLVGSYNLEACLTVIAVPCMMPYGPIYIHDPAVIYPYIVTPYA